MIARVIRWSLANRLLVLAATVLLVCWGLWAVQRMPLDALPDLSDTQVIIRTQFPGQAPQIVEDQVTYPLATTMLSVPGVKTVRAYSLFGDSFVYVLFEDGVDLYWARSRVLEYLNQAQARLPPGANAALGPDATGVGWIFEYALVDRSGRHDLGQLRALQDWFLRYELKTVPNVAEVASVGGMVRQYQVVLDPTRLQGYGITQARVIEAIRGSNQEAGGSVVEAGEAEYMVRARGYLATLEDFRSIPLVTTPAGVTVNLSDVARIQIGPEARRGIAELDGEGEVAGGIVVMRSGHNARDTIAAVKAKLDELKPSLPPGVELVTTYDRSQLIDRAVANLRDKLVEEFIVIALVCGLFLFHFRSALVAVVALPVGVLTAFVVMHYQGVNANIMSLGGIAIAIGAMVDAAVVMIENAHQHLQRFRQAQPGVALTPTQRWALIGEATVEVGPALFVSLLIITLSFIPVFALEAQEGRLFSPLAFTKTYAMAVAAGLSVTLVPVMMGYLIRGRIPDEHRNPLNRVLIAGYRPVLRLALRHPVGTLALAVGVMLSAAWPLAQLGGEFIPPLDEGDLLYMPSALPGLSAAKASELLQLTDRLIRTVPEVATVFGKAGRAESATDPAPLEMFETTIQFKPRAQWRPGMTQEKLVEALDRVVRVPGLSNVWVPPIRNRIDMLATGIKSPVGIKISGADLAEIDRLAARVAAVVKPVPGVSSALAERLTGGRYIDVVPDRRAAGRHGLQVADIQSVVSSALGGENIGEVIDGRQRFPINVRYPREYRDSLDRVRALPIVTERGSQLRLGDVAQVSVQAGPSMLKSENGQALHVGLRRPARARPAYRGHRHAARRARPGETPSGLFDRVVGSVRIPGTRHAASESRRSRHAGGHLSAAVPDLSRSGGGLAHHGRSPVRAGRRLLADLAARACRVGGERHRLHRPGRRRRRVRRGHAGVPQDCVGPPRGKRCRARRSGVARSGRGRRGPAAAAEIDDRRRHPRRAVTNHAESWHRVGSDAAHRRTHGGRHGHRAPAFAAGDSRGVVPADASPATRAAVGASVARATGASPARAPGRRRRPRRRRCSGPARLGREPRRRRRPSAGPRRRLRRPARLHHRRRAKRGRP